MNLLLSTTILIHFRKIIFFLILITTSIFAQVDTTIVQDTLVNANRSSTQLKYSIFKAIENNPFYFNRLQYEHNSFLIPFDFNFYDNLDINDYTQTPLSMISNMDDKRMGINHALSLQRRWAEQNSLGILGQVLGYANAAAAATLLYFHLKKYHKEYGF